MEQMPMNAVNLVSSTLSVKFPRYQVHTPAIAQSNNSISLPAGNDSTESLNECLEGTQRSSLAMQRDRVLSDLTFRQSNFRHRRMPS